MKLTMKQKKFCQLYAASGNATSSAIDAGYSKRTAKLIGCENMSKPYLAAYIKELGQAGENSRIAGISERNELLTSILRNETGDEGISTSDRLRALDLLNRATGVYIDKKEVAVNGKVGVNHVAFTVAPVTAKAI